MAEQIASLVAVIGADISGALGGLNKVSSGLQGAAAQMRSTGAMLTAGVTLPVIGFLGAAVKAASDLDSQMAQTNAVIKSTGGVAGVTAQQVDDLAKKFSLSTRFSDDQVISAENLLLTFRSIGKQIFPDVTQATLDMSQALGQDTKSSAIQLGKALEDPVRGITALRRVGVAFTDSQMNLIKSLVKSGDLLGAQKIILKEIQTEFGGSAKAAGQTFAGQMDILNHKFEDFQEKIGVIIIPILEKFLNVASIVVDWLSKLPTPVLTAGIAFLGLAAAIGPVLGILGSIGTVLGFLASPIGIIIGLVAALGAAWATNFLGIRDITYKIITNINGLIKSTIDLLTALSLKLSGYNITGTTQASNGANFGGIGAGANITPGGVSGTIGSHALGGFVGGPTLSTLGERGSEFVVPHNGALAIRDSGGRMPDTLHVVLRADQFEQHIYVNVADAIRGAV